MHKAFKTATGMPYGTVNLKRGVPKGFILFKSFKKQFINYVIILTKVRLLKPGLKLIIQIICHLIYLIQIKN